MREILFRAKRIDNGEWIYGSYVRQTDNYGDPVDWHYIIEGTNTLDYDIDEPIRVDPSTLCQFTGLTDKNGNRIWENDIINKVDTNALGWHRERICTVSWNKHGYWQIMTEYGDGYWIGEFEEEQLEVLGNVIDNPELLEEET